MTKNPKMPTDLNERAKAAMPRPPTDDDRDMPILKIDSDPIDALKVMMETGTGEDDPRRVAEREKERQNARDRAGERWSPTERRRYSPT